MLKELQKYKETKQKFNQEITLHEEVAFMDGFEDGFEAGKHAARLELEREMLLTLNPCIGGIQ
jgi:flagellar biosynthesis/type III secretory pathway protein FliH